MLCGDNKLGKENNEVFLIKTTIEMVAAAKEMRVAVENIATV